MSDPPSCPLVGPEGRLEKRKHAPRCCRDRREQRRGQRRPGPSTNLSPMWLLYHPRALSVKSLTLPWTAVNPCAAARGEGRSRSRSASSPPHRPIARGTTRESSRIKAAPAVAPCSVMYGGSLRLKLRLSLLLNSSHNWHGLCRLFRLFRLFRGGSLRTRRWYRRARGTCAGGGSCGAVAPSQRDWKLGAWRASPLALQLC